MNGELVCLRCGEEGRGARCDCGGVLDPRYDDSERSERGDVWAYSDLPVGASEAVTMGEGGTPLVECPRLADAAGVASFYVKDESRNPTGSVRDREMSVAVSAAAEEGAERVRLYSTGDSGVSAAAYAARAGIDAEVFVPSRASHDVKSMINVHGGEMTVVRGRVSEAKEAASGSGAYSLSPFRTPYRHDGAKTAGYEIRDSVEADHVVCPVGSGTVFLGLDKALDSSLHAVQPEGCAPLVEAFETGSYEPCESPDTVVGEVEIPDPEAAHEVLDVLESGVAVSDGDALDAGLSAATDDGIELSPSGALGVAGALELSDSFGSDEAVVAVNPSSGRNSADVLRNRLVYHGE